MSGPLRKSSESLAIGTAWGAISLAHPCPACFLATGAFIINGIRERLKGR